MRLLFIILICFQTSVLAYNLEQESYKNQGVLVCKPTDISINIYNLLSSNKILNINDYINWLQNNITYKFDKNDYWQSPIETIKNKTGDCEDFAILNKAVLNVLGYNATVFIMRNTTSAHAFCIFQDNDRYNMIDNSTLITLNAKSIREIATYLFIATDFVIFTQVNIKTHKETTLFRKSQLIKN